MKNIFLAITALYIVILCSLNACQKESISTTTPITIKDTTSISIKDTVVKGRNILILVRETGSLQPVANCPVNLFRRYTVSYPATRNVYERYDSLGRTDKNGKFVWYWNGDSLPRNIYIGFANGIYEGNENISVAPFGPVPGYYYEGWTLSSGTVRLRIEIKKKSLPFPGVEIVQYRTGYYQQTPNWDSKISFSAKKLPLDTTILLHNIAPASFTYGIRYGLDNSNYQSYLFSAQSKQFPITFKARDTTDQHIVIEE